MNKNKIFRYLIYILLLSFFLVACSNNKKPEIINSQIKIDRSTPEKILQQSYKFETNMNEKLLTECFYQLKIDVSFLMLKIKSFQVEKISLVKLVKIQQKDNFAVASCMYDTYFSGIKSPRQDVEVVKFIKDTDGWSILNDVNDVKNISQEDSEWLNTTETSQKNYIWTDENIRKILDDQSNFDNTNKAFMEAASKKLEEVSKNK